MIFASNVGTSIPLFKCGHVPTCPHAHMPTFPVGIYSFFLTFFNIKKTLKLYNWYLVFFSNMTYFVAIHVTYHRHTVIESIYTLQYTGM